MPYDLQWNYGYPYPFLAPNRYFQDDRYVFSFLRFFAGAQKMTKSPGRKGWKSDRTTLHPPYAFCPQIFFQRMSKGDWILWWFWPCLEKLPCFFGKTLWNKALKERLVFFWEEKTRPSKKTANDWKNKENIQKFSEVVTKQKAGKC
jgi:hypothetical protein